MEKTIYQKIVDEHDSLTFTREKNSQIWFRNKAITVSKSKVVPTKIILERENITTINRLSFIGKLFLYNYAPKNRATLDYYDTFPIVFPFKIVPNGFYGINLHYLPIAYRAILMDNLYSLLNSQDMTEDTTRLSKMNYSVLESRRNLKAFKPCVHMYLNRNIRTKVAVIPPNEWELALFLPLQSFKKKSEQVVWAESVLKIRKRKK